MRLDFETKRSGKTNANKNTNNSLLQDQINETAAVVYFLFIFSDIALLLLLKSVICWQSKKNQFKQIKEKNSFPLFACKFFFSVFHYKITKSLSKHTVSQERVFFLTNID